MTDDQPREITRELLASMPLPEYSEDAAKHDRGKLLIIGGSPRLPGPAILAARAALRVGCGTVRVAAPAGLATQIGIAVPKLMVLPLPELPAPAGLDAQATLALLEEQYPACRAVVIGLGLDQTEEVGRVVRQVVAGAPLPLLVDAQALYLWNENGPAPSGEESPQAAASRVFTPHPAEMSALIGVEVEAIQANRAAIARNFARQQQATLVLKGPKTLIASPGGALYLNTAGTRGLGTAGSGDVLAGVIGGLLAQSLEPAAAAVWGVHLHALAGETVAKDLGEDGIPASDLVECLPVVLRSLRRHTKKKG